ncbi:MAG: DNA translocase FtsK 4TM domain-containing protein, partial [Pararhodobacter sp.]
MASFPSPQRDPLIDTRLQAMLSQRGKELLGLCLIGAGLVLAMIIGTYSASDPTWMAATDAPVENAFGRMGAAIAAPLMTIMGRGAWGIPLALGIWGLRLVIHRGEEHVLGRSFFAPLAFALGAVWQSSLVPGAGWGQPFGLGGMFGDTVLAALMTALPMTTFVANLMTLATFVGALALYLFVLGSSGPELIRIGRFLLTGLAITWSWLLSLMGISVRGMGGLALRGHDHWQTRREAKAQVRAAAAPALAQHQAHHPAWSEPAAPAWHEPPQAARPGYRPLHADPRGEHVAPRSAPPYGHQEPPVSVRRAPVAPPQQQEPRQWQPEPYAEAYADSYASPRAPIHAPHHANHHAQPHAPQHATQHAPRHAVPYTPASHTPAPRAPVPVAAPVITPEDAPQSWSRPERQGVLGRVAALGRRAEPDTLGQNRAAQNWAASDGALIEQPSAPQTQTAEAPSPEGLRARIAELMTSRSRAKPVLRFDPAQYPAKPQPVQPAQPPLTASRREPVVAAPALPPATGFSFSHAFGYQATPAYPGATAPGYAAAATARLAEAPVVLEDEDDDLYED